MPLLFGNTASAGVGDGVYVTSGLILNLDAGNSLSYPGSGTTWTNLNGSANNGTLVNGPTYSSANSGYIQFDGVNDYVNVPYSSALDVSNGQYSVETWVYVPSTVASDAIPFSRATYGSNERSFESSFTNTGGSISFNYGHYASGWYYLNTSAFGTGNTWYHIVVTNTGSNASIYINNTQVATRSGMPNSTTVTTVPFQIGATFGSSYNGGYANIKVAVTRFYNRGISGSEVTQNYNALKWRFGL